MSRMQVADYVDEIDPILNEDLDLFDEGDSSEAALTNVSEDEDEYEDCF